MDDWQDDKVRTGELGEEPRDGELFFGPSYKVRKGDRIAQLVVAPVVLCDAVEVDELGDTERGGGGFGSTGK